MQTEPSYKNWQIWMIRIVWIIMLLALAVSLGSRDTVHIVLAVVGFGLLTACVFARARTLRHLSRRLRPTSIPPPGAAMIPPVQKTVLRVFAPRRIKVGETVIVTVEMYSYTFLPYMDFSDTVLKRVLSGGRHPPYSITLETPSFEYSPHGPVIVSGRQRYPLIWRWVLEPQSLGTKHIQLYMDDNIQEALGPNAGGRDPIEIKVEVVSEIGLSQRAIYWLKRIGVAAGILLTLPFLAPAFEELGKRIFEKLEQWLL